MHLFDSDVNFSCSGIVAQGMGPAVGAALSRKLQKKEGVAVAFAGEGATNQGGFHESLNLASVWKLPVVFVIEDNAWGISVAKSTATSVPRNDVRAASYNMPGVYVPDNDPTAIFEAAGEAIERARAGDGPTLIEIDTYRLAGHFMGDAEDYRPAGEKDALLAKDPIPRFRDRLLADGELAEDQDNGIVSRSRALVDEAITYARESDYPEPEEALRKVFA